MEIPGGVLITPNIGKAVRENDKTAIPINSDESVTEARTPCGRFRQSRDAFLRFGRFCKSEKGIPMMCRIGTGEFVNTR